MKHSEQEVQRRRPILEASQRILGRDYKSLYRTEQLGKAFGFEAGEPVFERIYNLVRHITDPSLDLLPAHSFDRLAHFLRGVEDQIERISQFQTNSSDPARTRDSLISSLDAQYFELFKEMPVASLLFVENLGAQAVLGRAEEVSKTIDQLASETQTSLESKVKDVDQIIERMRAASLKGALTGYAQFFEGAANEAAHASFKWLCATAIVAAVCFLTLAYLVWEWIPKDYSASELIQVGGAKLALFTIGFYALSWCGRNYKAQCHIQVVNRHRANTLNSMEAFANSATNPQIREAILVHASSAIFSQVNTGFIPDQADAPTTPTIMEIIRGSKEG